MTAILNAKRTDALMAAGVTIVDPASTSIGPDVTVGADTILHPNVFLEGRTTVGSGCVIHACVRLVDTVVEDNVVIEQLLRHHRVVPGQRCPARSVRAPAAAVSR